MWTDVAYKDFRDAFRSRAIAVASVLVVTVAVGVLAFEFVRGPTTATATRLPVLLGGAFSWLLPIIALVASYGAILHERSSGSLRFLLGLPNSRTGIVVGKFVGRSVVVVIPVAGSLALVSVGAAAIGVRVPFVRYLGFFALTALFALVFVAVGLAASTVSTSEMRTVAVTVGLYFWFRIVWNVSRTLAVYVSYGYLPVESRLPAWYFLAGRVDPITAYLVAANELFQPSDVANPFLTTPPPSVSATIPSPWLELSSMCVWGALALAAARYRFSTVDLK
jgi:ABC-2 type transport system permease protein